jgi:hypothetical protein
VLRPLADEAESGGKRGDLLAFLTNVSVLARVSEGCRGFSALMDANAWRQLMRRLRSATFEACLVSIHRV